MSKPLHCWMGPGLGLLMMVLALSCGGDKAGPGDFCEKDSDCSEGLICNDANICVKPDTGDCEPPCQPFETCVDGQCVPIDPGSDKDGDGWANTLDCDDLDPFTYPEDTDNQIPGGFEYCDGKDNDCDTETDEGCRPCQEGDSQPCGTDTGECTQGTQSCSAGAWGACSGKAPTPEEADDLDNDCDGATDEGLPCSGDAARGCGVETGECSPGQQHCENDVWSDCDGVVPAPEKCDTLDNDCDGLVDDGFMIDQACTGSGVCGAGVYECAGETSYRCSTEPGGSADGSQPEMCDGLDDDCDGETDEDFSYIQENTDEKFIGESCDGVGMCGIGTVECDGTTGARCSTDPGGSAFVLVPETCDGNDNDCDGLTDNGLPDADNDTFSICDDCDDTNPAVNPDADEACNGIDDNCDGQTDEGDNDALCPPTSHVIQGTCNVNTGMCVVADSATDCEDGWWDMNGVWSDGCEVELDGVADTCADASILQDVVDFPAGVGETVTGNLVPAGDEDWYRVRGIDNFDDDEAIDQCDNYNVRIRFNPAPPTGVVMTVALDDCSAVNPNCPNYYTDFNHNYNLNSGAGAARLGECECRMVNTSGFNICSKEDRTFYIRVFRLAGNPVTAEDYTLEITNGL